MSDSPITFALTEQQFVDAAKLHAKPNRIRRMVRFAITAFVLFSAWQQWQLGHQNYALFLILILPLAMGLHWLAYPFFRMAYRRSPALRESLTVGVKPDRLEFDSANGKQSIDYSQLSGYRENQDYLLLYINRRQFINLPKYLAQQGLDFNMIHAGLKQYQVKNWD